MHFTRSQSKHDQVNPVFSERDAQDTRLKRNNMSSGGVSIKSRQYSVTSKREAGAVSQSGRSRQAPTVGEINYQNDEQIPLGGDRTEAEQQDPFKETAVYNEEGQQEEAELLLPALSPERAVVSMSRTHSWPEQKVGEGGAAPGSVEEPELV